LKALLITLLLFSVAAHAEEFKCPEQFPAKDVSLPDDSGSSRLRPAHFSGTYFESGPLYVSPAVPDITKVMGGWDIEFQVGAPDNPDQRWMVCRYGGKEWGEGSIERWIKLPQRFTRCRLKVRETRHPGLQAEWTYKASCE
jgi:hypothetical protein